MSSVSRSYRLSLLLTLAIPLLALCATKSVKAQISTNDLLEIAPKQFMVDGDDPYIVFNAGQLNSTGTARFILIDLGSELNGAPLELFFKNENSVFNPHYKLSFMVRSFPAILALPNDVVVSNSTRLRLDVNQCPDCRINFNSIPTLVTSLESTSPDANLVEPTSVQNGIVQLDETGLEISLRGWQLNDLEGEFSRFEITATDPFLVSPRQVISTHQLAGVYFKLKAPISGEIWNDYQLFYQTNRHAFEAQASSTLRIADSNDGVVEFMVPLHFLSKELPSDEILERLRLDLPEVSGNWSLLEVRLLHEDQASDYKASIPNQLVHIKHQRARGLALIKKSMNNVLADLSFAISYLVLLTFICFFFLRAYRSAN